MSFTSNYSPTTINRVLKNYEYLEDNSSVSDRFYEVSLDLSIDLDQLEYQSDVFAENFSCHGNINFFKVLRIKQNQVMKVLKEIYVYSYAKSLYNGIYYHQISGSSELGSALRGHACLFHLLINPSNSSNRSDYHISYRISLGTADYKKALLLSLIGKFPFLSEHSKFTKDSFGTSPFFIGNYERHISNLETDFYSKNHIATNDTEESSKKDKSDPNYPEGKLALYKLTESSASSITSFSNTPVINSFVNKANSKFYFITVGNGISVHNNSSFIYNKANFLFFSDDERNDKKKTERIYSVIELSKNQQHLVCNEVFCNTGIKCKFIRKVAKSSRPIKVPTPDRLTELIKKHGSKLEEYILEVISTKIYEIETDLEEEFIEWIKSLVK